MVPPGVVAVISPFGTSLWTRREGTAQTDTFNVATKSYFFRMILTKSRLAAEGPLITMTVRVGRNGTIANTPSTEAKRKKKPGRNQFMILGDAFRVESFTNPQWEVKLEEASLRTASS